MPRVEPIKVIENPLAGVVSDEGDELGEGISEARIPLLRHSLKRHSTPSTSLPFDEKQRGGGGGPISSGSTSGGGSASSNPGGQPGRSTSSSQIISYGSSVSASSTAANYDPSRSGMSVSPTGSSTNSSNTNVMVAAAVNGKHSPGSGIGITQSQSLQILGNPPIKSSSVGKYNPVSSSSSTAPGSASVHHPPPPYSLRCGAGNVVVVSDKEGGRVTSGYVPVSPGDPLLISDSSSPHSRSNSQTCFQEDDGYCIAVTKNSEGTVVDTTIVKVSRIGNPKKNVIAETRIMMTSSNVDDPGGGGGGGGCEQAGGGKRGSIGGGGGGGSRIDLNLSTSTLRPIEDGAVEEGDRETWSQGLDFLLSIIGFAVDLANVWRFPYFCYKNGGGAFLIPYFLMLALSAIPVFYMELLLGQSIRQGPISMWKICPLFKGVGYCAVTVSYFVSFYYNTIMCWSLHFTISSFSSPLPWTLCNNSWNSEQCYTPEVVGDDAIDALREEYYPPWPNDTSLALDTSDSDYDDSTSFWRNESRFAPFPRDDYYGNNGNKRPQKYRPPNATSPASEYFRNCVLEMPGHNIDNLGSPKVDLLVCLAVIYCLLYVILFRGIRSTGKVVYVTALLPYVVMLILLIRGVMLEGAVDGIYYYLVPNMTKLWEIGVWSDAAKQIFFSSGAGFGVHLTYASYNNFHNNCYRDCIITSCVNCFTSIFSGFVIFTFLGSMAHRQGRPIEEVVNVGPGLVFEVYPEAVGTLPGAQFWSLLFFIMLIMLGIDSAMGGLECVITGITDEWKGFFKRKKHGRECFMFFCVLISFLIGIINVTRGGMYTFTFLDTYAAGISLLLSVLCEILAVSWVYGLDQLCKDAEAMLGFAPGLYWRICWKFVSPLLIATIIILDLITASELTHEDYRYPDWAQIFGYIFTFIPIMCVPVVGFIEFMKYPGDCKTKLSYAITPVSEHAAIKEGGRIRRMQSSHWSYFR